MSLSTFLTFIMLQGIVALIVPSEGRMPLIGTKYSYSASAMNRINLKDSYWSVGMKS